MMPIPGQKIFKLLLDNIQNKVYSIIESVFLIPKINQESKSLIVNIRLLVEVSGINVGRDN